MEKPSREAQRASLDPVLVVDAYGGVGIPGAMRTSQFSSKSSPSSVKVRDDMPGGLKVRSTGLGRHMSGRESCRVHEMKGGEEAPIRLSCVRIKES